MAELEIEVLGMERGQCGPVGGAGTLSLVDKGIPPTPLTRAKVSRVPIGGGGLFHSSSPSLQHPPQV